MTSEILKQLHWRYACKKFDVSRNISEEKLAILKEAFNLTATSYGLQPLKMVVISDKNTKAALVPMTMGQTQIANASHVLVLCRETTLDTAFIERYFSNVEAIRKTPSEILAPFKNFLIDDFKDKSQDEKNNWMVKQAYIALGNLLTVCALEKIDACPMEGFNPAQYDEFLKLTQKGLQSVLVLAVGYRAEDDLFASLAKVRRGIDNVIINL